MSKAVLIQSSVQTHVCLIKINRPECLNALNPQLVQELESALWAADQDQIIKVIVLTGFYEADAQGHSAFVAGADIDFMQHLSFLDAYEQNFITQHWEAIKYTRKPVIAAVNGFALGGGCELMMCCDIVIAGESAQFGQPEVKIGTMPGMGGTQRLPRMIGKAKAMEWILTGNVYSAFDAEKAGLISRIVKDEAVLETALKMAHQIAAYSRPLLMMIKESVNRSFESSLEEGLLFERRQFQHTFSLDDLKEGMRAFSEKRQPNFKNK